ncbi:uncharacterized protein C24B11.05-like isoform X3 [Triticum dicoccoides]|uniref:uncharacterized protein C24B11.05-like isoform X3 n=1 Tax=Triticum dicoccoides TaxID=85692 RepID=UPI00189150E6|nr:uncharacterized protein C24B11.05-like isoform X3 [Triticum dicoccoides]XP_044415118.1 uncharacterized protein C24B11.05-like isoform X3 [Triticum aestivum]
MNQKLGMEMNKVASLCSLLYINYGTTLASLLAIGYQIDYDDFHSFVHARGLPYDKIKPDPVLKNMLQSMRVRKLLCCHIFTNSDMDHTKIFLERLGLKDCFTNGIICFETLNKPYLRLPRDNAVTPTIFDIDGHNARSGGKLPKTPVLCKPNTTAMKDALNKFNVDPSKAIFFDDSERNIKAGKDIGMRIVLIGKSNRVDGADHAVPSIHNINVLLPELL